MAEIINENAAWNLCKSTYSLGYGVAHDVVPHNILDSVFCEIMKSEGYGYDDAWGESDKLQDSLPFVGNIHEAMNGIVSDFLGQDDDHLNMFSVRIFPRGHDATRIHRNSAFFGPWFFGVTISGIAPFYVFNNEDLEYGQTVPLQKGLDETNPIKKEIMKPGSVWGLNTDIWSAPHCGGRVNAEEDRMVLLLYGNPYGEKRTKRRSL